MPQTTKDLHSGKLTWKPKKGPIKTTVLLKGDYIGFRVSLGECIGAASLSSNKRFIISGVGGLSFGEATFCLAESTRTFC